MEEEKGFKKLIKGFSDISTEKMKKVSSESGEKAKEAFEKISTIAKDTSEDVANFLDDKRRDIKTNMYCPVFKEQLYNDEIKLPRIIQLLNEDIHSNVDVCEGAIAYLPKIGKTRVFKLMKDNIYITNLTFYPDTNGIMYIQDPYTENYYIDINKYFDYNKNRRIAELEQIANDLGATYFKTTIIEEQKVLVSTKKHLKINANIEIKNVNADYDDDLSLAAKRYDIVNVCSESKSVGKEPNEPKLICFKGDHSIESLIKMRMGDNPILEKSYTLSYRGSTDISLDFAQDIDFVIKKLGLNISANASVSANVERENRLYFDYFIRFK